MEHLLFLNRGFQFSCCVKAGISHYFFFIFFLFTVWYGVWPKLFGPCLNIHVLCRYVCWLPRLRLPIRCVSVHSCFDYLNTNLAPLNINLFISCILMFGVRDFSVKMRASWDKSQFFWLNKLVSNLDVFNPS